MNHVKVYEAKNTKIRNIEEYFPHLFYFLNDNQHQKEYEYLKSLNLTYEQYVNLAEIIEDYSRERYDDGHMAGQDENYDY